MFGWYVLGLQIPPNPVSIARNHFKVPKFSGPSGVQSWRSRDGSHPTERVSNLSTPPNPTQVRKKHLKFDPVILRILGFLSSSFSQKYIIPSSKSLSQIWQGQKETLYVFFSVGVVTTYKPHLQGLKTFNMCHSLGRYQAPKQPMKFT